MASPRELGPNTLPCPSSTTSVLEPPRTPSPKDVNPRSPARGNGVAAALKVNAAALSLVDVSGEGGGEGDDPTPPSQQQMDVYTKNKAKMLETARKHG